MAACSHTPPAPVLRAEKCSTAASCHGGRSPAFHCSTGAARSPASAWLRPRPGQPRAGASAYVVLVRATRAPWRATRLARTDVRSRGATRRRYVRRRTTVRGPSTGSTRRPAVKLLNCLVTKPKPKNETDKPDPRTPVTSGLKEAVMIASALGHDGHRLVPRARSRHAGLMRRSGRVR